VKRRAAGLWIGMALAAAALTAACQPEPEALPPVGADLVALQQARCEADGNIWGRGGVEGTFLCYRRTRDAGQRCTRADDCSGACLARSGTCSPLDPMVGCQEVLTSSGARATLCLD
jgi:hypothetical protein